ncbi:MAG: TIR domain-containing protein, partial [Candidatus Aminicenantes bacterium]|nr:TIR domain-containing protein [Candidatus Aminicenantes bacterium]NIM82048.1 TIR domain-containing protein [Candidatus Aminicenantes bacterium]NIN24433.1 TIR domain-containing protein [Candidatus Aminicenantes bacterium]NIN48197.1 TIR domain-containing protein [Candidatus Aminicenantes bacterium]NIN91100.1 TIR domain-containing protein [Candidatus Aminicenantes bacterium]
KSTVLFFQEGPCKVHIFEQDFNEFAKKLRKKYEDSAGTSIEAFPDKKEDRPVVFICHAGEDKDYAVSLYEKMGQAGFAPWLDKENLQGGDQWNEVIKKAIKKEIDYFLVLQSKTLADKIEGYVNKEIVEARERQKEFRFGIRFIIPVKIEDCRLLEVLDDLQTIDLTDETGVDRLVQTIRRDFMKRGKR